MPKAIYIITAGAMGAAAIAARAFEAHGLIALPDINEPRIRDFSSGTEMLTVHALAILGLASLPGTSSRLGVLTLISFAVGTLLFAGPLLLFALTNTRTLIMLAPFGGVLLILGWLLVVLRGIFLINKIGAQ